MTEITPFNPHHHSPLLAQLADIHMACIQQDHTIMRFLPPLDRSRIISHWRDRAEQVVKGAQVLRLALAAPQTDASPLQHDAGAGGEREVAGCVILEMPSIETGPFRGEVTMLLVSPKFRRKGVGKMLLDRLEEVAWSEGRWLLMLGTETGSPAEEVYRRLGYVQYGIIPDFGISPADGSLKSGTFFYKDLRHYRGRS